VKSDFLAKSGRQSEFFLVKLAATGCIHQSVVIYVEHFPGEAPQELTVSQVISSLTLVKPHELLVETKPKRTTKSQGV